MELLSALTYLFSENGDYEQSTARDITTAVYRATAVWVRGSNREFFRFELLFCTFLILVSNLKREMGMLQSRINSER